MHLVTKEMRIVEKLQMMAAAGVVALHLRIASRMLATLAFTSFAVAAAPTGPRCAAAAAPSSWCGARRPQAFPPRLQLCVCCVRRARSRRVSERKSKDRRGGLSDLSILNQRTRMLPIDHSTSAKARCLCVRRVGVIQSIDRKARSRRRRRTCDGVSLCFFFSDVSLVARSIDRSIDRWGGAVLCGAFLPDPTSVEQTTEAPR